MGAIGYIIKLSTLASYRMKYRKTRADLLPVHIPVNNVLVG